MSILGGGSASGLGSVTATEPIDKRMQEFISSQIKCGILEQNPVIIGMVKEGIL